MKPDVILFDVDYYVNGVLKETFNYQTVITAEEQQLQSYHRPAQRHPIRRELALRVKYPDINFGEDTAYAKAIEPYLKTTKKIKPVYSHLFNTQTSATCKR